MLLQFIALLLLSSCSFLYKQSSPSMDLPQEYSVCCSDGNEDPSLLASWWSQFQDPLLEELLQESTKQNFDIRSCSTYIEQARSQLWVARANFAPELSTFEAAGKIHSSKEILSSPSTATTAAGIFPPLKNFFLWGFDASWEIDFFGKNRNTKRAAEYTLQATEEQRKYTRLFVLAEVARLYTEIRGEQARLQISKQKEATLEETLSLSKELFASGLSDAQDVEEVQANLHACKSQTPILENLLSHAIANLAFLLGVPPEVLKQRFELKGRIPQAQGKVPLGLPSDLLLRRPDIKEAEYTLHAAGCITNKTKAELFPSFSLTGVLGGLSRQFPRLFSSSSRLWLAFPSIDWSLFQGGKTLAAIHAASAEQELAAIQYEKTVLSSLKEVENALSSYATNGIRSQELLLEGNAQKKRLLQTLHLQESGLASKQMLLQSYEELFVTQEKYIEAKQQTMISLISLYKSLGGGWAPFTQEQ